MRTSFLLFLAIISVFTLEIGLETLVLGSAQTVQAQTVPDGSTATQVNGNAIAPIGSGTVNGGNLYHSFNEFNVPQSGVVFNTGNSSVNGAEVQNIINRVTGSNPSAVLGTIESRQAFPNANLYLVNPNGVVFGQNARLDIGGSFHATTGTGLGFDNGQTFNADKNSLNFPSGDPKSIRFAIAQPAGIINQGNLSVDSGKSITLTGGSIVNTGTLTAPGGNIALTSVAGNSQVELRSPDAVLGLQVTSNAVPSNWSGKITELPKLAELLTGKVTEANQVVVKADGSLALVANPASTDIPVTNGMTIVSGLIDVSTPSLGKGGVIGIFGEKVGLANAQLHASGLNGGGTVLIGGDFQGKGIVPNAQQTYVSANSLIDANALFTGNGGRVVIWADQSTQFLGNISAKGGTQSGDGGFVEVSGKQNLDYKGIVNTLAPNGKIGTLLLDPTNITISNAGVDLLTNSSPFGNNAPSPNPSIAPALINASATNVVLQATQSITFVDPVAIAAAGDSLTAQAGNSININASISTNGGAVTLSANDNTAGTATGAGNIFVSSGSTIATNGGAIGLTVQGTGGFINISGASTLNSGGGTINFSTSGAGISIAGGTINSNGGDISINGTNTTGTGVALAGATNNINSGSGKIAITGVSGGTGDGIKIAANTTLQSTTGAIALNGTSANGQGLSLQGSGINSSGNISLIGSSISASGFNLTGAGAITLTSTRSINIGNITTSGNSVNVTSNTDSIIAGNISTVGANGGNVTLKASTQIQTGSIDARGLTGSGGNVSIDPTGNIVIGSIDTSSATQGGNVSVITTGGNLRVLGLTSSSSCGGASICTTGGSGGSVFIQHGGLNAFNIGNSSVNGTSGTIITGTSTLNIGTIIQVGNSTFTQGNISITPAAALIPGQTTNSGNSNVIQAPLKPSDLSIDDPIRLRILEIRDILKKRVDLLLLEDNLSAAFEVLEAGYVAELETFLERDLNAPPLTLEDGRQLLSDLSLRSGSVTALVYPIVLDDRIEILVIPPRDKGKPFRRYVKNVNPATVEAALIDYRSNLQDVNSQDYLKDAQQLYNWIMAPIDAQLKAAKIETLVFVMDVGLRVIPPAALHDGKQFLVERYASVNIPALRVTRLESRDRTNNRVLAMGLTEPIEGFAALPAAEVEVTTIGKTGAIFLNREFTVDNLQNQRQSSRYSILHLATHGKFISDRVDGAYIQLWNSRLRLDQFPALRFDNPLVELMTLSACETAVGNNLGISGLSVESGARSVLASLWAVSDSGTAPLMISFYHNFPNELSKAIALQKTQLSLLRGEVKIEGGKITGVEGFPNLKVLEPTVNIDLKHPFYWSPFVLVGNWL
ncbi:CHAT domain-containing protein [Tumidithrix elongata RA019]|uniref:CHAT domain-containing protein n=1 Tax=Tumidithrix elongata BACA0141 TaxID=2716417 RepID=A0AAW9PZN0_9CYAN|nr:CHAT domain-containing protein [Tumidithrix elongata RA019]